MRRLLILWMLAIGSLLGEQSIVLQSGKTGAYSSASTTTVGDFRMEMRLHGCATGASWKEVWQAFYNGASGAGGQVRLDSTTLWIHDWQDDSAGGTAVSVSFADRADFLIRYQRSATGLSLMLEIWDVAGTNWAGATDTITTPANTWVRNQTAGSGTGDTCSIAWVRYYDSLVTYPGASAPALTGTGNLANWALEGNGTESVNGWDLTLTGSPSFATTPTYDPVANISGPHTARATAATAYDGSASVSFIGDLTYAWTKVSGTGTVVFSAPTAATTNVTFPSADEYVIRLTVDDGVTTDAQDYTVGSVSTDANYKVTGMDASMAAILGPLQMYGQVPWTWYDDRHKAVADFFGGLQTTDAGWDDDWNTALTGTISISNGGSTITGIGTSLQTLFCSGGTTPDTYPHLVAWYSLGEGTGRYPFTPVECTSQTVMTVAETAPFAMSGIQFGKMAQNYGYWINPSTNNNYYDNVMGFYSLYYRTGLTVYRDYARELADRWWTMPYIDQCEPYKNGWSTFSLDPRRVALTGLIARAVDGRPEMWAGLKGCFDSYAALITAGTTIWDVRENAYQISVVALGALLDPTPANRATYVTALENAITDNWAPNQQANGQWRNLTYGYSPWNGHPGTVSVEHGSTAVVGNLTTWPNTICTGQSFWVADADGSNGDPVAYDCTWVSGTSVTLSRTYQGTTASGRGWQFMNLVGWGTQPFQMGIVGRAWYYGYQALAAAKSASASTARQFVLDAADWITDYGYSTTAKGLYYGRDFANCEPIGDDVPLCGVDTVENARYLNVEVMATYSAAYALTGDAKYTTQGDKLFGAAWGGPATVGPQADGTYVSEYDDDEVTFTGKKAKNFGYGFGFGGSYTWPAARLGEAVILEGGTSTTGFTLPFGNIIQ
jgi:hypothetical protein